MIVQTYSAAQFQAKVAGLTAAVYAGVPAALFQPLGMLFQADVRRQFYSGHDAAGNPWRKLKHPRPAGGDKPLLNTGILANSYVAAADARGVSVSSTHPGAALHQNGGIVRPTKAKVLTIPMTREATRYGSPRRFPRKLFSRPGGKGLYESIPGEGRRKAKLVLHYLFASEVEVPARPVGFSERAQGEAAEMLAEHYLERF